MMGSNGFSRVVVNSYGLLWVLMCFCGLLCFFVPMCFYLLLWVLMGFCNGFL